MPHKFTVHKIKCKNDISGQVNKQIEGGHRDIRGNDVHICSDIVFNFTLRKNTEANCLNNTPVCIRNCRVRAQLQKRMT